MLICIKFLDFFQFLIINNFKFKLIFFVDKKRTQSALNCFENKVPEDKLQNNLFIEIDNHLKKVKESFADEAFIKTLGDKLNEIVTKEWKDRPEEEELIAERILFLIRNILLIKVPDEDLKDRLSSDQNAHDLLILLVSLIQM